MTIEPAISSDEATQMGSAEKWQGLGVKFRIGLSVLTKDGDALESMAKENPDVFLDAFESITSAKDMLESGNELMTAAIARMILAGQDGDGGVRS